MALRFALPAAPRTAAARALAGACLLASIACEDAATDPFAQLVAEEASAALALGADLTDPSAWEVPAGATVEQVDALARWMGSWDAPVAVGTEERRASYAVLAQLFTAELGRGGVAEEVDRLYAALRRAESLPEEDLPVHIREGIQIALAEQRQAAAALRGDDPESALEHALRGSDALRGVGPEAVARTLLHDVEGRMRRVASGDPYSEKDLERIERLVRGSREAVREQDWVLAIRRAFYARGLLDQPAAGTGGGNTQELK